MEQKQTYGFPAFLSLILPGFGQLIKGQIGKALLIWLGYAGIWVAIFLAMIFAIKFRGPENELTYFDYLVFFPVFWGGILGNFALWIWQIRDAYLSENAI